MNEWILKLLWSITEIQTDRPRQMEDLKKLETDILTHNLLPALCYILIQGSTSHFCFLTSVLNRSSKGVHLIPRRHSGTPRPKAADKGLTVTTVSCSHPLVEPGGHSLWLTEYLQATCRVRWGCRIHRLTSAEA